MYGLHRVRSVVMKDLQATRSDYKLYEDRSGVRHWRYPFTGILILCGPDQFYHEAGRDIVDGFPTCLSCIHVMARDENR